MDNKTIFIRTEKGEEEVCNKSAYLSGDLRRALRMVDGDATFGEISKSAAPSLRNMLDEVFQKLEKEGFIENSAKVSKIPRMAVPSRIVTPANKQVNDSLAELDFTGVFHAPTVEMMAAEAARAKAEADAKAHAQAEAMAMQQKAKAARLKAEQEVAQARAQADRVKQQAAEQAKVHEETEQRVRKEAEAVRVKAEQESARMRAELAAAKAKAETVIKARAEAERRAREEVVRLKAEQEKTQAELAKARAVAETKARLKAEQEAAKVREEAELAKRKAEAQVREREETERRVREEAEKARLKAEQEIALARAEAERIKQQAEAKAKEREEAERFALNEAEAARKKAEQEVARARAELEEAKAKAEAEARAREEAEAARIKVQQEAEVARLKAEQEAAQARAEAERIKQQAEAEAREREEAEAARKRAEQEAAQARAELEEAIERAEVEAKAREEAEQRARVEAEQEAARVRAELEDSRVKAEAREREEAEQRAQADAEAKTREVAEQRAREEEDAARVKAEQEAVQMRAEFEETQARAEAEAKAHEEAEQRGQEEAARLKNDREAEAARLKAEQEAAKVREEFELERQKAEAEERAQVEVARRFLDDMQQHVRDESESTQGQTKREAEAVLLQSVKDMAEAVGGEAGKPKSMVKQETRSSSATVLFFDVVGYTKQSVNKQTKIKKRFNQVLSDCLEARGDGDQIILDTGDGAAVGFLQHPEDALEVAMQFRKTIMANQHRDYPDLKVRVGIHLGPINIVKDMNGQSNMVGDGINDAQRVMSFAGTDQIYVSRSYFDFISRLSDEYAELFEYRGSLKDKHGREHPVFELVDATVQDEGFMHLQADEGTAQIKLEPFSIALPVDAVAAPAVVPETPEIRKEAEAPVSVVANYYREETVAKEPSVPPPTEVAKPADKAQMPSEEEVIKFANEQTRVWMEAEQRALETARTKAEQAAQEVEESRARKAKDRRAASRIRLSTLVAHIPWGKLGAGLLVALLAALFVVPYILPMQGYANRIEQLLAVRLGQPVHIGHMAGRLLPMPRLELDDVSIGAAEQVKVQQVRVNFALSVLFTSIKPIDSIELEGMQVSDVALPQVSAWLQRVAADAQYPVSSITLNEGKLEAEGIQLSGIGGKIDFDRSGKFFGAKLRAEGGKFSLDIAAAQGNKLPVSLTVHGSALPALPGLVFDDLNAKGELSGDGLEITEFDSHILSGMLLGSARIGWSSGWRAEGTLVAKVIPLQNISKVMGGDLDGTAQFRMQAANLSSLAEATSMEGTFTVRKGVINGIDIVETTRLRSRESQPGGRTHFDELSGQMSVAGGVYAFRQLKMKAGVLNATGTLDIAKQQLSGSVSAELTMRAGMGPTTLQIGGTTEGPSLRSAN